MAEPRTVTAGVERDLAELAKRDPDIEDSGLAALALSLAADLDSPDTAATAKAQASRTLLETLSQLRASVPPEQRKDSVDELNERRNRRLAGGAAT